MFMKKTLTTALFCISTLLATPALATNQHQLQITPSVDYELPSEEPQVFSNIFRWTINAECTVLQSDESSSLLFKVLRKTGTINDITLSRGESLRIDVHPDEIFQIAAVSGAAVELTNEGETTLITHCSAIADTIK
jgi:hypothetical protein